jgi:hypothetical protein
MMYEGTPLPTRYADREPEPSLGAQIVAGLLQSSVFALAVAGILASYCLLSSAAG